MGPAKWLVGVLALLMLVCASGAGAQQGAVEVLSPPDTSSPRATLETFRANAAAASRLLLEAYRQRVAEGGLFASAQVSAKVAEADRLLRRAARTLDLSAVPPAFLEETRIEAVFLLKEVLDRIPLPEADRVPDTAFLDRLAAEGRPPPAQWTIPSTEIRIVRMAEGPRAGEYLFSAGTVARLDELYDLADDFPRLSPETDIYDFFSHAPGKLLPPIWYEAIRAGPDWLFRVHADQAVWQWIGLALTLLAAVAACAAVARWRQRRAVPVNLVLRSAQRLFAPVSILLIAWLAFRIIDDTINITGPVLEVVQIAIIVIQTLALAWIVVLVCNGIAEFIIAAPSILPNSLDANLLRAAFRVLGIVGAVLILGYAATEIGIPLVGVLAGLGVGGLAIALAAQPTIENFIGGVILYADRPVSAGDFCQFGDMMGVVDEIGIRSTRIRAPDRSMITVPNAEFAKLRLVNFNRRDYQMFRTVLGLRFETSPDQLRYVLTQARELLAAHPMVMRDRIRVRLQGIGASALEVEVRAFVATNDWEVFLAVREDLLLRLLALVPEAGTGFAFPSQTIYTARDSGLPAERKAAAEAAIAEMRQNGLLPFPDLDETKADALAGTLDWPPAGSIDRASAGDDPGAGASDRRLRGRPRLAADVEAE